MDAQIYIYIIYIIIYLLLFILFIFIYYFKFIIIYIILSNYVWSILFYRTKGHNVWQTRFHVRIKMRCCKRRVCKRKTLSGQLNTQVAYLPYRYLDI